MLCYVYWLVWLLLILLETMGLGKDVNEFLYFELIIIVIVENIREVFL